MNVEELKLLAQNDKLHGIYSKEDIDIDTYHAPDCPGISKTGLDMINRFPAYYKYYYLDGNMEEKKETPALIFGKAIHTAAFEPEIFDKTYTSDDFAISKGSRATKAYKQEREKYKFENPNSIILSVDVFDHVMKMRETLEKHPWTKNAFRNGNAEQTIFWKKSEILCKTRPDYIHKDGYIIDLKTTTDASEASKAIANFRYFVQEAMLRKGAEAVTGKEFKVIFVFIEKEPPYGIRIVNLDSNAQIHGEKIFDRNLRGYKDCLKNNYWPGYPNIVETVGLPKWIYYQEENECD